MAYEAKLIEMPLRLVPKESASADAARTTRRRTTGPVYLSEHSAPLHRAGSPTADRHAAVMLRERARGRRGRSATLSAVLDGTEDMPLALIGLDYLSDDRDSDDA
jgi:hypothetical protein